MGDFVEKVIDFFKTEDILDYLYTILRERPEIILIALASFFIITLSLWTLAERLEVKGWKMLIPLYRFAVLFRAVDLSPWLSLLLLIPVVNLAMVIVFNIHLCRKFSRSYIFVPLLILLPIIFLPIMAFGDGKHVYVKSPKREKIPREKRVKKARVENATIPSEKPAPTPEIILPKPPAESPSNSPLKTPTPVATLPVALTTAELREKREMKKAKTATPQMDFTPLRPVIPNEVLAMAEKDDMPLMKSGPRARDIACQARKARHTSEYEALLARQQSAQRKREANRAKHAVKKPASKPVQKPIAKRPIAKPAPTSAPKPIARPVPRPISPKPVPTSASKPIKITVSTPDSKPAPKPTHGRRIPIE